MDIIVTDAHGHDLGYVSNFELDVAFGESENDFELVIPKDSTVELRNGSRWYVENSDIGGIIDGVAYDFDRFGKVTRYKGRTWQGVLSHKIITPPSGQAYLTVSGEANSVIRDLISKLGLTSYYKGSDANSGIMVNYQFHRYTDAYSGLLNMLASVNALLDVKCINEHVVLSAKLSEPYNLYAEQRDFSIERTYRCTNHLVCLGSGKLEKRIVLHLYADSHGNISQTKSLSGLYEIVEVYDDNNSDLKALTENGTKKLKELQIKPKIELSINDDGLPLDIGMKVIAEDNGVIVEGVVTKKIVKYERGNASYEYEIGR